MINCEGVQAFRGTMKITWVTGKVQEIRGDWVRKDVSGYDMWYGWDGKRSYSYEAEACTVLEDETGDL